MILSLYLCLILVVPLHYCKQVFTNVFSEALNKNKEMKTKQIIKMMDGESSNLGSFPRVAKQKKVDFDRKDFFICLFVFSM